MTFVLDASTTLAWHFEDEVTEPLRALARTALRDGVVVPQHWYLEVTSGLLRGERRRRTSPAQTTAFLLQLDEFDTEVELLSPVEIFSSVLPLARLHRLSVYDASYLDLAQRRSLPLATQDAALASAAETSGVALVGKRMKP